jgi:hypothetical protein
MILSNSNHGVMLFIPVTYSKLFIELKWYSLIDIKKCLSWFYGKGSHKNDQRIAVLCRGTLPGAARAGSSESQRYP